MKNLKVEKPILCLGDVNPDIILPYGDSKANMRRLAQGLPVTGESTEAQIFSGGSIGNTASGLARLGGNCYFAGKAGLDSYGQFCKEDFEKDGVGTDYLVLDPNIPTVVVMAVVDEDKERFLYVFPNENQSHLQLKPEDLPDDLIEKISWVHTTGFMLRHNPAADTVVEFMEKCHEAGKIVSLDLNLRIELNPFTEEFKNRIERLVAISDVLLGSGTEEFMPLTGASTPQEAARMLANENRMVISRFGANGVEIYANGKEDYVDCYKVNVVDTVGAGDAFNAGFMAAVSRGEDLKFAVQYACAAAGYTLQKVGARTMPDNETILKFMQETEVNR